MLFAFIVGFFIGRGSGQREVTRLIKYELNLSDRSKTIKEIDKRVPRRTVAQMLETAKERQI